MPGSDSPTSTSPGLLIRVGDAVVAGVFLVAIVLEIWIVTELPWSRFQQIAATVIAPVVAVPVAFRGSRPLPAYAVNAAAMFAMIVLGYQSDVYQWSNLLLLFSATLVAPDRWSRAILASGLGGVVVYFASFPDEDRTVGVMVLGLWFVVWLLGRMQRAKQRETRLRADRDVAAELAAARETRLELEEQRTSMARELHDLIGHTVNVMVVHAGAGRRAIDDDPETAKRALATIESTGRGALDELDRVLGILRSEDLHAPLTPLPDLSALPALVEEFRGAGLAVQVETSGAVASLPSGVALSIYRIVQEALTNTLKHGAATRADVAITADDEGVTVVIADDGVGGPTPSTTPDPRSSRSTGSGRGLTGIVERAQLHGGTAAFESADGYRVSCSIPLAASSAEVVS